MLLLILVLQLAAAVRGLASEHALLSRRCAVTAALACALPHLQPSAAAVAAVAAGAAETERERLLRLIAADAPESDVLSAIDAIVPLDPSKGAAASSELLDGEWLLLWSAKATAFSPLLALPRPIRPRSRQLLGPPAASLVGAGRVVQLLDLPAATEIILSSGVRPAAADGASLEIFPPFRLETSLLGGLARNTLVEAGSDAEFRALNARSEEAQLAGRNLYKQTYLETSGGTGDLRISTVVAGDPVIVGSVFVHRRS